jgi:hypothetical protein
VEFYLLSVILGKALGEVNNHGKVGCKFSFSPSTRLLG